MVFAARPDRFIRDKALPFDFPEIVPFFYCLFFISFCDDFIDFEAIDFLLLRLRL